MEGLVPILIDLLGGAIGGNVAGALLKKYSLGTLLNSIVGIIGGPIGAKLLAMVGVAAQGGSMDIGSILANIGTSGVGGAVLMIIVGVIRQAMAKK